MLTTNADGTPKTTGYLVENPKVKDALFLAAGLAATAYAGGNDMILGAGLGLASYAGMKLIEGFYSPAVSGFSAYVQPANIAGYHVSGNAYVPPANIAALKKQERIKVPVQQQVMFTPGL